MAISFVSAAKSVSTVGATSLAVTMPAGFAAGDLLILAMNFTAGSTAVTGLTGWTQLSWSPVADTTVAHADFYWKISTGSEAPTVTWTTSDKPVFGCFAYRGVDGAAPIVASNGTLDSTASLTITCPTVNNTGSGVEWAVCVLMQRSTTLADAGAAITQNAALTERFDYNNSGAGSSAWGFTEMADSAGAVTAGNHAYNGTFTGSTASGHKQAAVFYLAPAAAGGAEQPELMLLGAGT